MAKNSITDYSKTASLNTDIQSVDIDEGCLPSGINNAIRELMADLAAMNDGTVTLTSPSFAAATITGDLTVDTNTLHVDSTNNRVGIGTSSPLSKLHLTKATDVHITLQSTGDNQSLIGSKANDLYFGQTSSSANIIFKKGVTSGDHPATSGTESMRITSSGRVGIGTTSPTADLTVTNGSSGGTLSIGNNAAGSTSVRYLQFGESSDYSIQSNANSYMRFYAEGAERMRIDSSGNVGIGTSSTASSSAVKTVFSNATGGTYIQANSGSNGGAVFGTDGGGASLFFTYTGAVGSESYSERMRIDSSGRVGIGTSSPTRTLYVDGQIGASGRIHTASGSATDCGLGVGDDNTGLFRAATNSIGFSTDGSERMRIDSSGNVLVGKTSDAFGTAGCELRPEGSLRITRNNSTAGFFNRINSDGTIISLYRDGTQRGQIGISAARPYIGSSSSTAHSSLKFTDSGGEGIIHPCTYTGAVADNSVDLGYSAARFDNIYATNGTIQTSDQNEKQDIEALSEAEQRVAVAAKGLLRKFRWIDSVEEKGDDARIHFGIIAQDLQAAFEAEGLDAGRYAMFINSTWTDEETGEERSRMGVRYNQLLAFIIAAI